MKNILVGLILIFMASCTQQQARRPVSHSEGSFMKESVERNKKLVAGEEKDIIAIIKSNPDIKYLPSKKGFWYYYINKNSKDTIRPRKGDIAYFEYEVKDLKGNTIYSKDDLGNQTYNVDKQNIMTGLQDGIKMMRKSEKITFLFPSHIAYGYHGDNNKIASNEPIICVVTLNQIQREKTAVQMSNQPIITTPIVPSTKNSKSRAIEQVKEKNELVEPKETKEMP